MKLCIIRNFLSLGQLKKNLFLTIAFVSSGKPERVPLKWKDKRTCQMGNSGYSQRVAMFTLKRR